jgi:GT2 family glycosyltransferase
MTDDDCVVDRSWAAEILRAFTRDPRIGLVFGNVVPAPFDRLKGFVPAYEREGPFLAAGLGKKLEVEGMGACMAVKRDAAIELGGFDERLGAGSPLGAGEDVDLTLRMLTSGYAVFETPDIRVTHHRFESWANSPGLVRSYWRGAGAALGKYVRQRPLSGSVLLARLAWRFVFGRSRVARSLGSHGSIVARVTAFVNGLGTGATLSANSTPAFLRADDPSERDGAL